eukprot:GHVT01084972.1.p1 GENE.GHVT01084972.1~~GHVT01084972.1.p1  ORF type:complete len:105 (+),score=4.69 GHVT01084972.1:208-522(+)
MSLKSAGALFEGWLKGEATLPIHTPRKVIRGNEVFGKVPPPWQATGVKRSVGCASTADFKFQFFLGWRPAPTWPVPRLQYRPGSHSMTSANPTAFLRYLNFRSI